MKPLFILCLVSLFRAAAPTSDYVQGGAPCDTESDCSLSGLCANSVCVCDPWWTGARCDLLNLQNAASDQQGLQVPGYKSWGGHALQAPDGTWQGFFSFMCRHATLGQWTTKSSPRQPAWRGPTPFATWWRSPGRTTP